MALFPEINLQNNFAYFVKRVPRRIRGKKICLIVSWSSLTCTVRKSTIASLSWIRRLKWRSKASYARPWTTSRTYLFSHWTYWEHWTLRSLDSSTRYWRTSRAWNFMWSNVGLVYLPKNVLVAFMVHWHPWNKFHFSIYPRANNQELFDTLPAKIKWWTELWNKEGVLEKRLVRMMDEGQIEASTLREFEEKEDAGN